jgi:hypothetical protein
MNEYHKIDTVFQRDAATKHKSLIFGAYSNPAFEYLANNIWGFTEKVDGTNIRIMFKDGRVSFGGKTDAAQIPAFLVDRLRQKFDTPEQIEVFRAIFPDGGCLYGEGYGAKIQKGGGNYRADQDFVLFDVRVGSWWLMRDAVEDVAARLGLEVVPIIGRGTIAAMLDLAQTGFHSQWGPFVAEGIVARPECELMTRNGQRIITKIKHKDFALVAKAA